MGHFISGEYAYYRGVARVDFTRLMQRFISGEYDCYREPSFIDLVVSGSGLHRVGADVCLF